MRYMHPPIMQMKGSTSPKPFLSSSYWYLYSSSSSSSTTFWCAMVCENLEDIKSYIREWTSGPLWFKAYIFANINYNGAILGWHILFYNLYWKLGYLFPLSTYADLIESWLILETYPWCSVSSPFVVSISPFADMQQKSIVSPDMKVEVEETPWATLK